MTKQKLLLGAKDWRCIANKLIEISKNVESRPAFSEQTIELFQSFIYNLGKPLSDDIDTLSTSLYESIMSESVEG